MHLISITALFTNPIGSYLLMRTPKEAFPSGANMTNETVLSAENSTDDNPGVNEALLNVWGLAPTHRQRRHQRPQPADGKPYSFQRPVLNLHRPAPHPTRLT